MKPYTTVVSSVSPGISNLVSKYLRQTTIPLERCEECLLAETSKTGCSLNIYFRKIFDLAMRGFGYTFASWPLSTVACHQIRRCVMLFVVSQQNAFRHQIQKARRG